MKEKPTTIIKDAFEPQRAVAFFLRLHRHLPDDHCGGNAISGCNYREDGRSINFKNERVDELQKDPEFVKKEKEVSDSVTKYHGELKITP